MKIPLRVLGLTLILGNGLWAWSPRFHEAQTRAAVKRAP